MKQMNDNCIIVFWEPKPALRGGDSMKTVGSISAKGVEWLESRMFMLDRSLWPR